MSTLHPIDQAAKVLGVSLDGLGSRLGVTKGAVSQWKSPGRTVPAEHCPKIEELTEGRVRCEALNPKVDWSYLRKSDLVQQAPTPEGAPAHS